MASITIRADSGVVVTARDWTQGLDLTGPVIATATADAQGFVTLTGLADGHKYRATWTYGGVLESVGFRTDDTAGVGGAAAVDASLSAKGITRLSAAPASAIDPVAVGDNDLRVRAASLPKYYVDTANGNDSNDGAFPGRAFKTISAAVAAAGSTTSEINIVGGTYTETVTVTQSHVFRGRGKAFDAGRVEIQAPGLSANCVTISGAAPVFEGIYTRPPSAAATWTGIGWSLTNATDTELRNCGHRAEDATVIDGTYGGTALFMTATEGAYIEKFRFSRCRRGIHLSTEASENVFMDIRGSTTSQYALLIDGTPCGGNVFIHWKSVNTLVTGGAVVADIGPDPAVADGGQNYFIGFDADETGTHNTILVRSHHNTFENVVTAPVTTMQVDGNYNLFRNAKQNGDPWVFNGNTNRVEALRVGGTITDNGVGNIFDRIDGGVPTPAPGTQGAAVRAALKYPGATTIGVAGGAAAPPATPARWLSLMDPATGQRFMVPGYLPAASPVVDSFIRADNASVIGTADSGQAWTSNVGVWGIASNQLYHSAANADAVASLDAGIADGVVEVDYVVAAGSANTGLAWRLLNGTNFFYFQGANVRKFVAGVVTPIGTLAGGTPAAGSHLRVTLKGSKHVIEVDGVVGLVFTDAFQQTATKHGLYSNFDTAARWKNFRVTA